MKQKQVKTPAKAVKQTKVTKKAAPPKKVQEDVVESEEEEEEVVKKVAVGKKPVTKKATKAKNVVAVVPVEEEDDDEVEEDDEEQVQEEDQDDEELEEEDEAMDVEDVEEDDENDDEEAEDEQNEDEEAEDEDDENKEEEEPTIPSKVKSGEIPSTVPVNKVVHITKLPKKCKQLDIVEGFGKYGAIDQIHIVTTTGGTVANVAFKTEKGAKAALAATKKAKVKDSLVTVTSVKEKSEEKKPKKFAASRDRSLYIRYLKAGTTVKDIKDHFEDCGEIEDVKLVNKYNNTFSFVTFTDKSSVATALKLHNSILNGVNIGVYENSDNPTKVGKLYDENLTVMVKNKQSLENVDPDKMESIFAKCGEIDSMDIVCKKNVLAFITFKNEQAVQKALKLNGKTENDIELELELYNPYNKRTSIYVSNLPKDCTEEDLEKRFSKAGGITSIFHKGIFAIIRFADSDAYCKSFLFNESFIKQQMIFVEPYSIRKKMMLKAQQLKNLQKRAFKRPAQNGKSVFKPKRAKI